MVVPSNFSQIPIVQFEGGQFRLLFQPQMRTLVKEYEPVHINGGQIRPVDFKTPQ